MDFPVTPLVDEPETVSELTSTEMLNLISNARPILEEEKNLLEISGKHVLVVGDLHGNFGAAQYIVALWKEQSAHPLVFLGDYVDRGEQQLETINFLLALKLLYPKRVILLRGNHETPSINSYYGFSSACVKEFGGKAKRMYNEYNILFSYLSPACLYRRILLIHGGIPYRLNTLKELNSLPKGDLDADNEILGQILWNDPSEFYQGFEPNWERGIHCTFGKKVFFGFLEKHNLTMVLRAHQFFYEGYKYFFENKLLSIFSSPGYHGGSKAKIADVSEKGEIQLTDVNIQ